MLNKSGHKRVGILMHCATLVCSMSAVQVLSVFVSLMVICK